MAVEGMLDRGIQYSLESKITGFPLTARGNDDNNPWIPAPCSLIAGTSFAGMTIKPPGFLLKTCRNDEGAGRQE